MCLNCTWAGSSRQAHVAISTSFFPMNIIISQIKVKNMVSEKRVFWHSPQIRCHFDTLPVKKDMFHVLYNMWSFEIDPDTLIISQQAGSSLKNWARDHTCFNFFSFKTAIDMYYSRLYLTNWIFPRCKFLEGISLKEGCLTFPSVRT